MTPGDRLVIVLLGTATLHTAAGVGLGALPGQQAARPAPQLEMVDIEPPPPAPAAPPVAPDPEPAAPTPPPTPTAPPPPAPRAPRVTQPTTTPSPTTPTVDEPATPAAGGGPVIKLDNLAPPGRGVAVAPGPRTVGRVGKGGKGGGDGRGTGSGTAAGAPPAQPVSIAVLKTRARPRRGQDYIDMDKDYPAEARRLGIEGQIKVRLAISAEGKVTQRKLLTRLGHGLDELALRSADQLEFDPATDSDDRAVASTEVWTFTFTLPR